MTRKEESDFERILGEDYQKSNCLPPVWPEPVVMQLYWSKEAPPSILLNRRREVAAAGRHRDQVDPNSVVLIRMRWPKEKSSISVLLRLGT